MKILIYTWGLFLLSALWVSMGGCDNDFAETGFEKDNEEPLIYDYLKGRPDLSIYKEICDYSGFNSWLSTAGSYTVFIPADTAFLALFRELKIENFKEKEPDYWLLYMKYHAIEVKKSTNAFDGGFMKDPTMMDRNTFLSVDVTSYSAMKLNNKAVIKEYNIRANNGYINVIDAVLMPPIESVYDRLKNASGGIYSRMLAMFEQNGLKSWLTDSVVTVFVETNYILDEIEESGGEAPESWDPEVQAEWLKYHIFPGKKYFTNEMDKKMLQPLREGDVVTFNIKTQSGDGQHSLFWNQAFRLSLNVDITALNGVIHEMYNRIEITPHTQGAVEMNLYGGSDTRKGYMQNVFAEAPARIRENMFYESYHQTTYKDPEPPICEFVAAQGGDAFRLTVPGVAKGSYKVRLVYREEYKPQRVVMMYNGQAIGGDINFANNNGDFTAYTKLKYKDCGSIEVREDGDVELRFLMMERNNLLIDMVELVPDLRF